MNKRDLFLKYIQIESWRNRGGGWLGTIYGYLNLGMLSQTFLMGGVAKLTILKDIPMMWLLVSAFIFGIFLEIIKVILGYLDFKKGIWKIQSEWNQKHETLAPFNYELKLTLEEICKKLNCENHFKDY